MQRATRVVELATPSGPALVHLDAPDGRDGRYGPKSAAFLLAMTHAAGGGVDTPDLLAVRDVAGARRWWRGCCSRTGSPGGGRLACSPARTRPGSSRARCASWPATSRWSRRARSNGARVACRTAAKAVGALGVVALAFPLHPPWNSAQVAGR